jgi:PAS domain S-box-containing protein
LKRLNLVLEGGPPAVFSPQLHPHLIPAVLPDGSLRIEQTTVSPIPADKIRKKRALIAIVDMTQPVRLLKEVTELREQALNEIEERKQAEAALRESEETSRVLLNATDSAFLMNSDGMVISTTESAAQKLGKRGDELVGVCTFDLFPSDVAQGRKARFDEVVRSGKPVRFEDQVGEAFFDNSFHPIFDAQGKVERVAVFAHDITERKRAEKILREDHDQLEKRVQERTIKLEAANLALEQEITERKLLESQLVQEQKLASIGQLAAGIAHEINTPIQYVGDNTRFFQDSFNDIFHVLEKYHRLLEATKTGTVSQGMVAEVGNALEEADVGYLIEEIPSAIRHSLEGIDRVTKIVQAMRAFSHPGVSEKTPIDLNKAIESTITVARNEWKYVAEMETHFDPDLPLVSGLLDEFNQVILNIILNAAHAIADIVGDGSNGKGTITIGTHRENDWAEIRISDTGTGIPEEIRLKVFDPFFTTKEVGKGTGQGLAIAHNVVVEKHGWTIAFETEVGKGTTFIIRLPIEDESM